MRRYRKETGSKVVAAARLKPSAVAADRDLVRIEDQSPASPSGPVGSPGPHPVGPVVTNRRFRSPGIRPARRKPPVIEAFGPGPVLDPARARSPGCPACPIRAPLSRVGHAEGEPTSGRFRMVGGAAAEGQDGCSVREFRACSPCGRCQDPNRCPAATRMIVSRIRTCLSAAAARATVVRGTKSVGPVARRTFLPQGGAKVPDVRTARTCAIR